MGRPRPTVERQRLRDHSPNQDIKRDSIEKENESEFLAERPLSDKIQQIKLQNQPTSPEDLGRIDDAQFSQCRCNVKG